VRIPLSLLACMLAAALPAAATADMPPDPATPPAPLFLAEADAVPTSEGHATLAWEMPGDAQRGVPDLTFELQQSTEPGFPSPRLRYAGPDWALFVSGLREGETYFRVRARDANGTVGPWSQPITVDVAYPGRGQVLLLLAVGCVVFVATTAAIVAGRLSDREPPPGREREAHG
jgi:hypothetical protein